MKAVIFDMDGVLIDAAGIHRRCFRQACEEAGFTDFSDEDLEGLPTSVKLKRLGAPASVAVRKQELTMAATVRYPPDDPRRWFLQGCRAGGKKLACYTNSIRATAERFLFNAGLLDCLGFLLTNEDVTNPKPDPEGYLKAMRLMSVTPDETVIFEDSAVGIAAARASGAHVIETTFEGFMECNF